MLDGASPGSGKYQAQTVSAPQHFQSEDGYPAVSVGQSEDFSSLQSVL